MTDAATTTTALRAIPDRATTTPRRSAADRLRGLRRRIRAAVLARFRGRRTHRWLHRLGVGAIRHDPTFTSTRQAEVLSPVRVAAQNQVVGPLYGKNLSDGQPFYLSVHGLYRAGRITGPNVAIIGGYGMAKSSTAKTLYGLRAMAEGTRVIAFDRKKQRDGATVSGEYMRTADAVDGAVIALKRAGASRINILDPQIVEAGSDDTGVGQDELLMMVAAAACGGPLTDTRDSAPAYALRVAHKAALRHAKTEGRVATLHDVISHLYAPSADDVPGPVTAQGTKVLAEEGLVSQRSLTEWGLPVALNLSRFVDGDWSGLIDGETGDDEGRPLDLTSQLVVIDTSDLAEGSELLGLMMVIMATYVSQSLARVRGQKLLIVEEAYNLDALGRVPAVFRALAKRGRAVGLSTVCLVHHLGDLREGSDMWALVRETEVVHIFRQDKRDDIDQAIRFFNLPQWSRESLRTLSQGCSIVKIGQEPPVIVQHLRTPLETTLTDTDAGMIDAPEAAPFTKEK